MNQAQVLDIFTLLQVTNIVIMIHEKELIKKSIKEDSLKVLLSRAFVLFLPLIVIISILLKPLES